MENALYVKMATDGWKSQVKLFDSLLEKISDEKMMDEMAPGRNRGVYILGHLTAVHDMMLPLLRFEEATHPELQPVFITAPDKTIQEIPRVEMLREYWKTVNDKLLDHFSHLPAEEWFTRHASVTAEDFEKEPHRNRLSVLLGRTAHLNYHRGQMIFLVSR